MRFEEVLSHYLAGGAIQRQSRGSQSYSRLPNYLEQEDWKERWLSDDDLLASDWRCLDLGQVERIIRQNTLKEAQYLVRCAAAEIARMPHPVDWLPVFEKVLEVRRNES